MFESFSSALVTDSVVEPLAIWRNMWSAEESFKVAKAARTYIEQLVTETGVPESSKAIA